jgi:hypothetical protein
METNGKPASRRQLANIRRLQLEMGEDEPEITEELSVSEASKLITELVSRARQNGFATVQRKMGSLIDVPAPSALFRPRLSMWHEILPLGSEDYDQNDRFRPK